MHPYPFLLFDLDGTISESAPGIMKSVAHGLAAVNIHEHRPEVLRTFIGPPLNVRARELYHMDAEDIATFVTAFRERYEQGGGILDCQPYPGMGQLLAAAKAAGLVSAVASSKPEPFVREIISHFGFADDFSVICGSEVGDELKQPPVGSQKARIIRKAMGQLEARGVPRDTLWSHAVMIGDTGYDIDGAKENHLPAIGVTYGYGTRAELTAHGADAIVDTVAQLSRLLLGRR